MEDTNNSVASTTTIKINKVQAVSIKPLNQFLHTKLKSLESKLVDYEQDKFALKELTTNYAGIVKKVELLEKRLIKLQAQFRLFTSTKTKKKDKKKQQLFEDNIGNTDEQNVSRDFGQLEEEIKSEPRSPDPDLDSDPEDYNQNNPEYKESTDKGRLLLHPSTTTLEDEEETEDQVDDNHPTSHTLDNNLSVVYLQCPSCPKKYKRKQELARHQIREHYPALNPFKCQFCSAAFDRPNYLSRHIKNKHPSNNTTDVLPTGLTTTTRRTRQPTFPCPYCRMSRSRTNLQVKLHSAHCVGLLTLSCTDPDCNQIKFTDKEALIAHNQKVHPKSVYPCLECARNFGSRDNLKEHVNSVHKRIKPYLCSICGHSTVYRSAYDKHVKTHEGARDYECGVCKKSYTSLHILKRHLRKIHGLDKIEVGNSTKGFGIRSRTR